MAKRKASKSKVDVVVPGNGVAAYGHPEAASPSRPEIGAQAHFKKAKSPARYRYDSSLAPELNWDGQNPAREEGEALLRAIEEATTLEEAKAAAARLKALSRPFLNWTGKAERRSFDVPTLPLFVHERLSTRAILETLKGHKHDRQMGLFDEVFGVAERVLSDQVLRAYEFEDNWVNRLILGDSLVVMNSLLHYESLGGQVQMIYIDPPYGVKFGSNFQPFVRRREVKHNEDEDISREPETVQAYRDTWELGLHSYLSYLRDRLLLARELLHTSGSVFVQISDENLHHVREVMDEVFGAENFISQISFQTTSGFETKTIATLGDFLLWYARDSTQTYVQKVYQEQEVELGEGNAKWLMLPDGTFRGVTAAERRFESSIPEGARPYLPGDLQSQGAAKEDQPFVFEGKTYRPGANSHWKARYPEGLERLARAGRIHVASNSLRYRRFASDFPFQERGNIWTDTITGNFTGEKVYVVQTNTKVIERCMHLTTRPGDLVIDPTCGSGTTAFIAEAWGRRWITIDTSRVPLALTRQRLLSATFEYFRLQDPQRGPCGGFLYEPQGRTKNRRPVGPGVVEKITLELIANDEPPTPVVLVDRPERDRTVLRVTGPFSFEATIATAEGLDEDPVTPGIQGEQHQDYVQRMIEVLRRAPVIRLPGNETFSLKQIRPPAKTLSLSAEAVVDSATLANVVDEIAPQPGLLRDQDPVAILFGPENGPISERGVREAWDEAGLKHYARLFVIGFGIDPKAREFIDRAGKTGIPAHYLQASMDLQMGDLLKNMRSSQVFAVCGLPDVDLKYAKASDRWQVELKGLDTFDPATMEALHLAGNDVPAWFLDTDYNGMVFRVRQAFFPRTGAWENLKRALKYQFEDSVWEHLAGTTSAPFQDGDHGQIAVKVIDPRGNELMVVKRLERTR